MENSFPRPRVWKPFVFSSFVLLTFTDKWRGVEGKYPLSSLYIHELVTIKKKRKENSLLPTAVWLHLSGRRARTCPINHHQHRAQGPLCLCWPFLAPSLLHTAPPERHLIDPACRKREGKPPHIHIFFSSPSSSSAFTLGLFFFSYSPLTVWRSGGAPGGSNATTYTHTFLGGWIITGIAGASGQRFIAQNIWIPPAAPRAAFLLIKEPALV